MSGESLPDVVVPVEHHDKHFHWLQGGKGPPIIGWMEGESWKLVPSHVVATVVPLDRASATASPRCVATHGYRYLGPCSPMLHMMIDEYQRAK